MGKKSPKLPKAPDPVATANAQGQWDLKTAIANANLNRINQYSPEGSLEFKQIGTNADGTPQYASYETYSPQQQALYDQQLQISNALSGLAGQNIDRVKQAQQTPFNFDNMTPLQSNVNTGGIQSGINYGYSPQMGFNPGGNVQMDFDTVGGIQRGLGDYGQVQQGLGNAGDIQRQLNFSGAPRLPGQDDFGAEARRVADALYGQATSRLDPLVAQQQRQLGTQLAAKGITEGSEAYRNAMDQFARNRTDAYNQANWSAIGAGGAEQSRLFGLALQARQQNVGETQAQGNFANQAQQQNWEQILGRGQFANQAQQQRYGQALGSGQFANEAQNQQYAQNQAAMEARNQAQNQQFTQNQALADFFNQAQEQGYGQALSSGAFANQAQQQRYNQDAANAALNNNVRQQQIQEASYLRNLPINDIAALLGTAGGVSQPDFADFAQVNMPGVDYAGLVQNQFNNQMQRAQIKNQAKSQGLGGLFGLGGSVLGGLASSGMLFSDRRLKEHLHRIGTTAKGIPTYTFNYIGSAIKQFGVLAQDVIKVIPEAVGLSNGYMTVDYGKVW